jgi:aryl sulfotransferase
MTEAAIAWPRKTRELHNHHMDSTVWNEIALRDGDVIVATYGKSGTTWTQQIVGQLVFAGDPTVPISDLSPWVDLRAVPKDMLLPALEAQTHRRIMKTHLPVDALGLSPKARYLYVGRDARDVIWSMYNHHSNANDLWYQMMNDTPGRVGPPIDRPDPDIRSYFLTWLEKDGHPFWSFWESVASWWAARTLPNVKLVHFEQLKADLPGQMREIAAFLGIELTQAQWSDAIAHCSFDYMKAHAEQMTPLGGAVFEGGASTFINKGVNGRWKDVLTLEDSLAYERMAEEKLGAACARWLKTGEGA